MFSFRETTPLRKLLMLKAMTGSESLVEATATPGNPCTFETDVAKALTQCKVNFAPVQSGSGDPSPENERPITGWTGLTVNHSGEDTSNPTQYHVTFPALGKNLITSTEYAGSFYNVGNGTDLAKALSNTSFSESNNVITVTTTSGWNGCIFATGLLKPGTYNVHTELGSGDVKRSCYVTDSDLITKGRISLVNDDIPVTFTEESRIAVFIGINPAGSGTVTNLQVESGDRYTNWESYTNTAYGGTVGLTSGVLTVDWEGISAKWSEWQNATDMGSGITRKQLLMVSNLQTGSAKNMCNVAPYGSSENADIHFYYTGSSGSVNRNCRMFLPSDMDGDTMVTVITNISVPKTYQLTAQQITALVGDNVLWSDANGNLEVKYMKKG